MLITSMLPLLSRYALGMDLLAGPDGAVTVTILPRRAPGKSDPEPGEIFPISLTGTAAEIDAELARGADGALGQMFAARAALADQIAAQRKAAEVAKAESAAKANPAAKPAAKPTSPKAETPPAATPPTAEPKPGEPASLW
ncbi:MAG: PRTRC system protein E [Sphingomonadales bacterium]|nr:PRTRC system protein E [Sphingomonadales bacterium]